VNRLAMLALVSVLAPLAGSVIAGVFGNTVGRKGAHRSTILGMMISFAAALLLAKNILIDGTAVYQGPLYTWLSGSAYFPFHFSMGFLLDPLTAVMMLVVTSISLLVHIYSIGYMADDPGYQRFFSYISLFTFAMLVLVTANNFVQLFAGWEGVGLASYLLIGFWFKRDSALLGSMKAFIVNRVGDFGFLLGIALILMATGSLDYQEVFAKVNLLASSHISLFSGYSWSVVTVICILLFIGAMGKSAQVPLHVWLPESMEGPTPISALIHAATMVTAGIFMISRMSPLFEHSPVALSVVLVVGATGALFTGLIAIVMNDIKRVIAYSTLSQLGYMMAALGVSAYSISVFHLVTHAFFKALLFLGAGSVIMGMHHEQDMRKMGGLWRHMPITYVTFLIGSLALVALPPFAGFYSKDSIIEAISLAHIPGAGYAYFCVFVGAFVTAIYTVRSLILTFHGKPRMDAHTLEHVHESPWVVTLPLILLAIPSVAIGAWLIGPMLYATPTLLANSVTVLPVHAEIFHEMSAEYHGIWGMALHALSSVLFWWVLSGMVIAWLCYSIFPGIPAGFAHRFKWIYQMLLNKYGFDLWNDWFFVRGTRKLGQLFFAVGDQVIIDGVVVNGSAMATRWLSLRGRLVQSGYLSRYLAVMVLGLLGILAWILVG